MTKDQIEQFRKELRPTEQATRFNIMTYYPSQCFENVLRDRAQKWAYIYHDLDPKEPHYHITAIFHTPTTLQAITDKIDYAYQQYCETNNLEYRKQRTTATLQDKDKVQETIEYYLHFDEDSKKKGKHLYDLQQIQTNSESYFRLDRIGQPQIDKKQVLQDENEQFLVDILDDSQPKSVKMRTMAKKYGRDYIKNFNAYQVFAYDLKYAEQCEKLNIPENNPYAKYIQPYKLFLYDLIDQSIANLQNVPDDDLKAFAEAHYAFKEAKQRLSDFEASPLDYPDFIHYVMIEKRKEHR